MTRSFTGPARWGGEGKRSVQATKPAAQTEAPEPPDNSPDATDAAKALAAEHGIVIQSVQGTGVDGRITKDDVAAVIDAQAQPEPEPEPEPLVFVEPIPDEADDAPPAEQA